MKLYYNKNILIIKNLKRNKNRFIMNLNNKKIELLKLKILIENKNNVLDSIKYLKKNKMNIRSYFKTYIQNKKSKNNLIFFNLYFIFKNVKLFFDFLFYGSKNFLIFNIINTILPGSYTNWKNNINDNQLFILPNICIYLNHKKDSKAEDYFYNELANLKIFQIILQNYYFFYEKLNKFDLFIPINLKNDKEFFLIVISFIKKFNKLSKIFSCYFEQFIFLKKNKLIKINNKITHYWTRTNTFKNKNRF